MSDKVLANDEKRLEVNGCKDQNPANKHDANIQDDKGTKSQENVCELESQTQLKTDKLITTPSDSSAEKKVISVTTPAVEKSSTVSSVSSSNMKTESTKSDLSMSTPNITPNSTTISNDQVANKIDSSSISTSPMTKDKEEKKDLKVTQNLPTTPINSNPSTQGNTNLNVLKSQEKVIEISNSNVAHKKNVENPNVQLKSFNLVNAELIKATKSAPTPVNQCFPKSSNSINLNSPSSKPIVTLSTSKPQLPQLKAATSTATQPILQDSFVAKEKRRKKKEASKDEKDKLRSGKRVRLQYQPYQAPEPMSMVPMYYRNSFRKPNHDDKIIVFNKGDFLAVRNESASFFVCKATQNVYKNSKKFKIQWLNNEKDPDIFTIDFYDQIDFECVLTNLKMARLDKGKYMLPKDESKRTMNILQRAINVEKGISEIPDPRHVVMDGVDVSVVGEAEEEELEKIQKTATPKIKRQKKDVIVRRVGRPKKTLVADRSKEKEKKSVKIIIKKKISQISTKDVSLVTSQSPKILKTASKNNRTRGLRGMKNGNTERPKDRPGKESKNKVANKKSSRLCAAPNKTKQRKK